MKNLTTKYFLVLYREHLDDLGETKCVAIFDMTTGDRIECMPSEIEEFSRLDELHLHDLADGVMEYCGSKEAFELITELSQQGFLCAMCMGTQGMDEMAADMKQFLYKSRFKDNPEPEEEESSFDDPVKLKRQLDLAVEREDYELAAILRDKLVLLITSK